MLKFTPRRRLTGGLRLPANKTLSTDSPIKRGLIPERLIVSTRQHRGASATPTVTIGQEVARGDTIAGATADGLADVHAPTSGRVSAIERRPVPLHASVSEETCIVIDTDGRDRAGSAIRPIEPAPTLHAFSEQVKSAGIVGLGGAIFPTAAKIGALGAEGCRLLIINGAECEPYISCDDMLMREAPAEILSGAEILRRAVGAPESIIAIERDKPQAIDAITAAIETLGLEHTRVAELPSIYPAGGERQLIDVLSGRELGSARLPADEGVLCQNVGTAFSLHNYFVNGRPLTNRIVTITGGGVAEPCNVEAMLGTTIADLIAFCGGYADEPQRLIHGGSMMGYALTEDSVPITKSTNCVIAATQAEIEPELEEWPCIRCGECSIACPSKLLPQDLLLAARASDTTALMHLSIDECIECGCCDIVCPSHIPLTQTFREAKLLTRRRAALKRFSDVTERRFQSRNARQQDEVDDEARRRQELKRVLEDDIERGREIEAVVARAREKRAAPESNDS